MAYTPTTYPISFSDWTAWVYGNLGIPTGALPSDSPWLQYAYDAAVATVNQYLANVPGPIYLLATYNLAADLLINWAPDQPGIVYPCSCSDPPASIGYFACLRLAWGLNSFTPGVIASSSDEATSSSYLNPEQLAQLTIDQLQNLKTPYGRVYLGYAQKVGNEFGIS